MGELSSVASASAVSMSRTPSASPASTVTMPMN